MKTFYYTLLFVFSYPAFASENLSLSMDWFTMSMWLFGGLALFLYGMELLVKGLLTVAGDKVKTLLGKLTANRVTGALTGAGVTAVIQSSSVTTVLTVGFVSAGLMTATQSAGVIMGANLGTTITAQMIAFKVTNFALILVAIGFAIQFFSSLSKRIALGRLIMGLGLIFFGMNVMSEGMAPLRDYDPFMTLMQSMQNPLLAILIGAVFTALVQSSSATIGVIIVMASNGFLTLPVGIALAMGANIGTTITAILATIGKSREAIRTGLIHVLFNFLAVLIWLPFIPELASLAMLISNHEVVHNGPNWLVLAENTPREIANANTLLNLISLLIFLPFVPVFVYLVNWLVPVVEDEKSQSLQADFLDENFINTPSLAFEAIYLELEHYQQKQNLFYRRLVALIEKPQVDKLSKENLNLQLFRNYQRNLLSYLGRVGKSELTAVDQEEFLALMAVVNGLESMLDAIEHNIINVLQSMVENDQKPSATMIDLVGKLTNEVAKSINNALLSVCKKDSQSALQIITMETTINLLLNDSLKHQIKRFQPTEQRLSIFRNEMQLIEGFKQLYSLSKRIAQLQLDKNTDEIVETQTEAQKVD